MAGSKSDNKRQQQKKLATYMAEHNVRRPASNGLSAFPVNQPGSAAYRRTLAKKR
jgi:hypothetical protein